MDTYKAARIIVAILVFVICLAITYLFLSRTDERVISDILATAKKGIPLGMQCGAVFADCEIEIEREDSICRPQQLLDEVKKEGSNPTKHKACLAALDKMKRQCKPGCTVMPDSVIVVPGELKAEITYANKETNMLQILSPGDRIPEGSCKATARRVVNLKAECG